MARQVYTRFGAIFSGETERFQGEKERRQSIEERSVCFFNYNKFQGFKKALINVLGFISEKRISQNCAHHFTGNVSCPKYVAPVVTRLDGSP